MANDPIIFWDAPTHLHGEKHSDWYWAVGLITLALAAVAIMFGEIILGIFIVVAVSTLVLHVSRPAHVVHYQITDRGIMSDSILYPFLSLESFWIPHDEFPAKIILKSHKLFMPHIVIYIDEVDPEEVREVLLRYIAETEHHEPFLKHLLERLGF